jgi:tRNA(fMet)-specific endonuclease VapC
MVVLDTDHVSFLERSDSETAVRLSSRLSRVPREDRATTIVSYAEQSRGWLAYLARARTLEERVTAYAKLSRHLEMYRSIQVLEFDVQAAEVYAELCSLRTRIGAMDLQIAAICLARDATLLSRNLAHFRRVPKLRVEDWTL